MRSSYSGPLHRSCFPKIRKSQGGHHLLQAAFLDALGFVIFLFSVATHHPLLGLYVLYHTQVEVSRCLFVPANTRSLKGETLSRPHVLWASVEHGTVEVAGGYPPGE